MHRATPSLSGWKASPTLQIHSIITLLLVVIILFSLSGCSPEATSTPVLPGQTAAEPTSPAGGEPVSAEIEPTEALPTATPTPSRPAWQPVTEPLLSQPLVAGQENVVEISGELKIVAPPGVLEGELPDMDIARLTNADEFPLPGVQSLGTYDVSLGDQHALLQPLTVTFTYDPTRLDPDAPASDHLIGGMWDTASGRWVMLPVEIDETAHTATFQVDHLSLMGLYYLAMYRHGCPTEHFNVYFDEAEIVKLTGNMKYNQPVKNCSGHPDFVRAVADFLEESYDAYVSQNFTPPSGKISVVAARPPNWSSDPVLDTLTGLLVIATDNWYDLDILRHQVAHELFHAFQLKMLGAKLYIPRQWWMDATADYAADKAAWVNSSLGRTKQMGKNIRPNYLKVGMQANEDFHAYSTAHFVDFLIEQSFGFLNFYSLWDSTDEAAVLPSLDAMLMDTYGQDLGQTYKDFAASMLFDLASPLPLGDAVWGVATSKTEVMSAETKELLVPFTAPTAGSALFGFRSEKARFLKAEWLNPNQGQVYLFYLRGGDGRNGAPYGNRMYAKLPATFPIYPEDVVYILMINPQEPDNLDFEISITESLVDVYTLDLKFDPTDAKCAENSDWGTGAYRLRIQKDGVTVAYSSAADDIFWTEFAEHTVEGSGTGNLNGGKMSVKMTSTDRVRMGDSDAQGNPVFGSITISANFELKENPDYPFTWNTLSVSGYADVMLPATEQFPGYTCRGMLKDVAIYPEFDFPMP